MLEAAAPPEGSGEKESICGGQEAKPEVKGLVEKTHRSSVRAVEWETEGRDPRKDEA